MMNPVLAPLRRPVVFLASSAPWRALGYHAVSLLLGWVMFFLYVVIVLFPLAPAWSHALAQLERQRVTWLSSSPIGNPHAPISGNFFTRAGARLGERATWREVAYSLIMALAAPFVSLGTLIVGASGVGLIVAPVVHSDVQVFGMPVVSVFARVLTALLGALICVVFLYATYGLSALQVGLAKLLLGPTEEELGRRVVTLETSRGRLVSSFEGERRRIERNLHDGPQQDLVSVSMQLGELAQSVEGEAVRSQVAAAQSRLERAMAGLRDTVRGVHPQVLDDAGLEAACAELGGAVRVDVQAGDGWQPGRRLATEIERAMYYTASEAVTNAIKHGGATCVRIVFSAEPPAMTVMDDGSGGADVEDGTGLAGLVERAEAIGATLTVLSPVGGPTTLHWSMP